eukprot:4058302-Prymnesium_polylepis.1
MPAASRSRPNQRLLSCTWSRGCTGAAVSENPECAISVRACARQTRGPMAECNVKHVRRALRTPCASARQHRTDS